MELSEFQFRLRGYFLVRNISKKVHESFDNHGLPPALEISGKLDKNNPYIVKKDNVRLYDDIASDYLNDALSGGLNSQNLERALLNLNKLPGLNATSTIVAGDQEGTSKIVLNLVEDDLVNGSISFDNYGNRYTGKQRTNISVDFNNPSKFGDQLSFQKIVNTSTNYEFSKISYEFPILHAKLEIRMKS